MEKKLRQHIEFQEALHKILEVSLHNISIEEKLSQILQLFLEISWLTIEKKGCFFITNADENSLDMIAFHNLSGELLNRCKNIKFGQCLCGLAAQSKKIIFRSCIEPDHSITFDGIQPHGHYIIPILHKGEVLGILNLYVKEGHIATDLENNFLRAAAILIEKIIWSDREISLEREKYKVLFERSTDAIILSEGGWFVDCNESAVKMFGYKNKEALVNISPVDLSPPFQLDGRSSQEAADEVKKIAFAKGHHSFEWYFQRSNGEIFPVEVLMTAMPFENGKQLLHVVLRDISRLKRQQQALQHMAYYDQLTGLPNRALFSDRFSLAIARCKRAKRMLAIGFLDLDNFKPINDRFGHAIGDEILTEVAQRITDSIREEDTVSRVGGDEFTLLLGEINSYKECETLVGRMLKSLAKPYLVDNHALSITASCGITIYPKDNADIDTLVRHADYAMYQAKHLGKNTFAFFDLATEKESQRHLEFMGRFNCAIKNNELRLFYQPKINMRTGEMFGLEALVRWEHPEKGLIMPSEFLPQVENTPLMIDLDNWVLNHALDQLSQWCAQGKSWSISVNIDAYHFMEAGFFDALRSALRKYPRVPAELLEIEILETVAFNDLEAVSINIEKCKSLGIRFALDDFGTGYSSLSYLKALPVDWIKIDRTFVRDILVDQQDFALIEGIISISNAFKRKIIAEGVETIEQGTTLLKLGCENAQGYVFSKPIPSNKVIKWEEKNQTRTVWQEDMVE